MATLDKVASVRDQLAGVMAAGELGTLAFACGVKKAQLQEIATGKTIPGFDDANRIYDAMAKLNGNEPEATPKPKRTSQRGGKQIGAGAAKAKAKANGADKPAAKAGPKVTGRTTTKGKAEKPAARPKGAQGGIDAEQRIHLLTKKNPYAEKSKSKAKKWDLLAEGMTVAEYVKKGGTVADLKRMVEFKRIALRK